MTPDEKAVRDIVARINEVWQIADPARIAEMLRPLFAPEMRITGPGFATMGDGRDAAVASYVEFAHNARITSFEMTEPSIHLAPGIAVATYGWRIAYVFAGVEYDDAGHDIFVLRPLGESWVATWRAMQPDGTRSSSSPA